MGFLRPDADSIAGNWTNESGSTPIYSSIDEVVASDADYAASGNLELSTPDTYRVRLSDVSGATLPCTVRYRYKSQKSGAQQVDLIVRLLQGASTVTSWSHTDISTSPVTAAQVVAAGITDFTDLSLEFQASLAGGLSGQPMGLLLTLTYP